MVGGDLEQVGLLLHGDLVYVHSHGMADTRESYLGGLSAGTWTYDELAHEIDVSPLGDRTALAVGRMRARGSAYGRSAEVTSQTMSVWVEHSAAWVLRSFQSTRLPAPRGEA